MTVKEKIEELLAWYKEIESEATSLCKRLGLPTNIVMKGKIDNLTTTLGNYKNLDEEYE